MNLDYVIVAVVSALAIAMHVVLYVLIRRWMDRDLALSFAGEDEAKRDYMRACLERAKREVASSLACQCSFNGRKASIPERARRS